MNSSLLAQRVKNGRRSNSPLRNVLVCVASFVMALQGESTAADYAATAIFHEVQKLDARLLDIGYRLTAANASFCPNLENTAGIMLHDIAQYKDRDTARVAFGFTTDIGVLAVVQGGPGYLAGVRSDDGLIAIGDQQLAELELPNVAKWKGDDSFARMDAVLAMFEAELAKPEPRITVQHHDGSDAIVPLTTILACQSQFQTDPGAGYSAAADGRLVTVSAKLIEYTADDDELAAIVAHELAHNILRHRARLDAAHVSRGGLFSGLDSNAAKIKATEIEADQLSVWLMANAGYDPQAAIRFWNRFGREHGAGIFSPSTHYRYKKRIALFEAEIAKMAAQPKGVNGYVPPLISALQTSNGSAAP